jgi:hypothetical protein
MAHAAACVERETVVDPPQIRVTVRGLGMLRECLAAGGALESA